MKRGKGHQSKPLREQGRDTNRTFLSLNNEVITLVKDILGHCLQACSSPTKNFGSPWKQGTFWVKQIQKKRARQEKSKRAFQRQERRPPRWLLDQAEEKLQNLARNGTLKKILRQLWGLLQEASKIKYQTGNPQEWSGVLMFFQKANIFEIHLV